jgi:hypothetical protein
VDLYAATTAHGLRLEPAHSKEKWQNLEKRGTVGYNEESPDKGGIDVKQQNPIAELLRRAAELSSRAAALADQGDVEGALALEAEADAFRTRARAQRVTPLTNAVHGVSPRKDRPDSVRGITIASLAEIGVPASPREVAEYAGARFATGIDHRALASLRRDEQRAWSSPRTARAVYVVPALEGRRFLPCRGKLALSDWPLGRRLIGPWSERADYLAATENLARQLAWLRNADPEAGGRLASLVKAYAATVPGALSAPGGAVDPAHVEAAVAGELAVLGPKDEAWRAEAAQRAEESLSEAEKLWGAKPPDLYSEASA